GLADVAQMVERPVFEAGKLGRARGRRSQRGHDPTLPVGPARVKHFVTQSYDTPRALAREPRALAREPRASGRPGSQHDVAVHRPELEAAAALADRALDATLAEVAGHGDR